MPDDRDVKFSFSKLGDLDEDERMVWGWASVSTIKDDLVVDLQEDIIEVPDLVRATTDFMESVRTGKRMHRGEQVATVVHSLPLTKEIAGSLGLELEQEGWVIGVKVHDDETWKMVKSGELAAFSIGGRAERELMQ